jgi:hypothetical protein
MRGLSDNGDYLEFPPCPWFESSGATVAGGVLSDFVGRWGLTLLIRGHYSREHQLAGCTRFV